jgi:hypothetical protein
MLQWLGIPAAFIAWGFAIYVAMVAPRTLAARLLIALLVIDGIAVISSYGNIVYVDRLAQWGDMRWWQIHQASDWLVITFYLAFIGVTVRSPLTRPFRKPLVRGALLATGSALAISMFFFDIPTLEGMTPILYPTIAIVLTFGFICAIHAWVIARDEASRARARAFTMAFGIRDVIWMLTFITSTLHAVGRIQEGGILYYVVPVAYALAVILYVPLVAYGMLRTQLFDIDLRLKRTLKRSTVAAAFVAAYFLVSELAASYLSSQLGTLLGLMCTATLIFFLEPIQRAAQRLSDAAMPNTRATPEYETYRKLQVYEAALHSALEQGGISGRERQLLNSLIESMGIDPQAAAALERDAQAEN